MSKKVLQDIIAKGKKIERGLPERKWDYSEEDGGEIVNVNETVIDEADEYTESEQEEGYVETEVVSEPPKRRERTPKNNFKYKDRDAGFLTASRITIFVIIILIVVGFIAASNIFSGSTVKVLLMKQTESIDSTFEATEAGSEGTLPYKMITLNKEETKNVIATAEEEVENKASGTIIIYNEYKTSPQTYVVRTRFQSPDGKIYRVAEAVVVPGMTKDGDTIVPGSVEVLVYGDQPGEEYNIEYVDFTIPGLKGLESYEKVYARSKTPMTGGYVGVLRTASDEDLDAAKEALQLSLKKTLSEQIETSVPEGYLFFNDGVFVDFQSEVSNDVNTSDSIVIVGKSTLRAFVFNESILSQKIAERVVSSYDGSMITVRNFPDITFRFLDKESFDPINDMSFNVKIKGDAYLVWGLDSAVFKGMLAGVQKDKFTELAQQFPSVRKAQAKVQPFWKRVFPKDVDKIIIEEMD